jgi:hypothetical protein
MRLKPNQQYRIRWIDAFGSAEWTHSEDLDKLIIQFSKPADQTLYFIKQTDDFYIFTSGKPGDNKPYIDIHGIPKGWVTEIKQIR